MRHYGPCLTAAILAIVMTIGAGAAAARSIPRVVLAVDGVADTRNLPVLLAERLGYFRDEGLVVTLVDAPADPSPAQLVKDGRADGAVAYYHHTFMSQVDDQMVTQAVAIMGVTPGLQIMVAERLRDQVHSIRDLKGRRIYTGGSNSGKTTTANWAMIHAGLSIADYTPLALKSRDEMARALADGRADAIVTHQPDADFYRNSGTAFMLADVGTVQGTSQALGTVFPSTALYLPRSFVAANPGTVQHLVNACLRALTYIQTHDPSAIAAVLPAKMGGADRTAFVRLLGEDKEMYDTDGLMPAAAARAEWEAMNALTPKYKTVKLEQTFTNRFVESSTIHVKAH